MEFIVITGLSGAGKSNVIRALEDIGFYCVDNMPPALLPTFGELIRQSGGKLSRVAIVTDVRGGSLFDDLFEALVELKNSGVNYKILFLNADDEVLIRRYKETRRKHPLTGDGDSSIADAVSKERALLETLRERADYVIDTSYISIAQLKEQVSKLFLEDTTSTITVTCLSFGFKYGSPGEADLVFDVRCLPNPYYVDELRHMTGLDEPVKRYVMDNKPAKGFVSRLYHMIDYMLPLYHDEGKAQLIIAIGCTGGKHRSVTLAEELYKHLEGKGWRAGVNHRDINKT